MLMRIQNDLFDLGAELATPADGKRSSPTSRSASSPSQVERIEQRHRPSQRAAVAAPLLRAAGRQPGRGGAAPGTDGEPAGGTADGGARRARSRTGSAVPALHYINRLSDFLFVASRSVNAGGAGDVLWVPGKNR